MLSCVEELPDVTAELEAVVTALRRVRVQRAGQAEFDLQDVLCGALAQAGIAHKREHRFGPRCRADIWVNGIVVEIKRQRPATTALLAGQLDRYAQQPCCRALVVVLEKSVLLPPLIQNKPVRIISLNALWGLAV